MMESNPRGLLRTIISMGNPQLSEAGVQERLEQQLAYGPPEVGVERGKAYLAYDATRVRRAGSPAVGHPLGESAIAAGCVQAGA